MDYTVACTGCGAAYDSDTALFRCTKCGSVLEVKYDYSTLRLGSGFRKLKVSHSKYAPFLPVGKRLVSMGEGGTELREDRKLSEELGLECRLFLKIETSNPTATFKDRGSSVEVSKAVELGFGRICCASTGNMGLSLATYAEAQGLECTVFISKSANREKIGKIKRKGAKISLVDGDFNAAMGEAERFAGNGVFMCGDYHYRKEGQKSLTFEVMEQLAYRVPDYLFVQVGNATLLAAIYKALAEFKIAGFIDRMPKLIAVQSRGCAPLVTAYDRKAQVKYAKPDTIADAIAVGFPTFGFEALRAIKNTHGSAIAVSDSKINGAVKLLHGTAGIGAEPGGAAGLAGFLQLYGENPSMFRKKSVAVIITGNNED